MENQRKGRGSFVDVRRKSLTLSNIFYDNEESVNVEKPKYSMKSYLESLTKEKQDWKDIYKRKKLLCKHNKEKCEFEPLILHKKNILKYLTPEDTYFLESKPDYMNMAKSIRKYVDSVNFLNKYKLDVINYYTNACNEVNLNTKDLVDDMCSVDLCEICNIKNCQNQNHKFSLQH